MRPPGKRCRHPEAQIIEWDRGIGGLEVEARRNLSLLDREDRLDQARDAGSTLQMTHVRLRRGDRQRHIVFPRHAQHRAERRGLDRIANRGRRAVQLDILNMRRIHIGTLVRLPQNRFLRGLAWHSQAVAATIAVDRAALKHAIHVISIRKGGSERLEGNDTPTLSPYIAIGARVKGEAAATGRQAAEPSGVKRPARIDVQVNATGEHEIRLSRAQAFAREMDCDERRRLRRIHRDARASQAERVGNPVGDHAAMEAGDRMAAD